MHWPAWNAPALPVMPWNRTFVFFPTRTDICSSRCLHGRDDLLRTVEHVVRGLDLETAGLQDLLALLHVRAFEAHDERHLESEFLRRRDDAFGDDVALHDAAEDVHEDPLHLGRRE